MIEISEERRKLIGKMNRLKRECAELEEKLAKLEAHDGSDGCPEDIDAQEKLVDEIAVLRRQYYAVRREVYPKG